MTTREAPVMVCETCNGGQPTTDCTIMIASSRQIEQVDYITGMNRPQGTPYCDTCNSRW